MMVDPVVKESEFVKKTAAKALRICCYGSSSADTPEKYLKAARELGFTLAKRGHTCVNGAGSFGCMAAMNDGAAEGDGSIVGVIHEIFIVDGGDAFAGGAHKVFRNLQPITLAQSKQRREQQQNDNNKPIREILVASGDDLQERKRLLVDGADALVVLPGGPGTWDELWEMVAERKVGLTDIPIVCMNVEGYYEPFKLMMDQCYKDKLIEHRPEDLVHFVSTPQEAVQWCEQQAQKVSKGRTVKTREEVLSGQSESSLSSVMKWMSTICFGKQTTQTWENGRLVEKNKSFLGSLSLVSFAAGVAVGALITSRIKS